MARSRFLWLAVLAVGAALTSSATAIEYTKLLPADTEAVTCINIRQILDSALVKSVGLAQAKEALNQALQGNDQINEYVKSLGIDPFTDINRITVAGPANKDSDKGVIVIEGKFSPEKFKKTAADVAKNHGDHLKIGKIGSRELWEVTVPQQDKTFFVTLADNQTLVAALSKASLSEALAQADGKKVELKKGMREVIDGVDGKASFYFAALSDALIQAIQEGLKNADVPNAVKVSDMAKELRQKLNALSGSITLSDDLKFQVTLSTKEPKTAKEMSQMVTMAQGVGILALNQAAQNNEQLMPLIEVVQNIRATTKGSIVIIRGGITADAINRVKRGN